MSQVALETAHRANLDRTAIAIPLAWTWAAGFALATALGLVPNPLVGENAIFVTNGGHNLVHLLTAAAFVIFAQLGARASMRFMIGFGVVYMLVGVLGFIVLGSVPETHLLGFVHINLMDNFLHVGLGILILASGLWARSQLQKTDDAIAH